MTLRLIAFALAVLGLLVAAGGHSAHAEQTSAISFPWEGGRAWLYLNGPHNGNAPVPAALDFQPPDARGKDCGYVSDAWVVAAADGKVIDMPNAIEIDHGNGFRTGYFHLADKQVTSGFVRAGERLGKPDCCPDGGEPLECYATTPHVHFYTTYHGAKQSIVGITIQGWTVQEDGCLQNGDDRRCPNAMLRSSAPPVNEALPSVAADVAVVVDGSEAARRDARLFLEALFTGDRAAIISYGRGGERLTGLSAPGIAQGIAIAHSESGDGDPLEGLTAACNLFAEEAKAPALAVMAFGAGWRDIEVPEEDASCFGPEGPKMFAYDTGGPAAEGASSSLADAGVHYRTLAGNTDLACEFQKVRSEISDDGLTACTSFVLREGEVVSVPFAVSEEQVSATFSVRWSFIGAQGDAHPSIHSVLFDPAQGRVEPRSGVSRYFGSSFQAFTVKTPAAGNWKIYVDGDGLPEEGVTLRLTAASVLKPGPATPRPSKTPAPEESDGVSETAGATASPTPSKARAPGQPRVPTPDPDQTPGPTDAATTPKPTRTPAPIPTPEETATPEPSATEAPGQS